jgi:hypothetical protein
LAVQQGDVNRFDYMRFAKGLLNSAGGVRVILNATVTNINTDAEGAVVKSVDLRGSDGALREVSCVEKATLPEMRYLLPLTLVSLRKD